MSHRRSLRWASGSRNRRNDVFASDAAAQQGNWSYVSSSEKGSITNGGRYGYLAANISISTERNGTSAIFSLRTLRNATYSIDLTTPGCLQDSSCQYRGRVAVSIAATPSDCGGRVPEVELDQTNEHDKVDTLFEGTIAEATSEFTPHLLLRPVAGAELPFFAVAGTARLTEAEDGDSIGSVCQSTTVSASSAADSENGSARNGAVIGVWVGVAPVALFVLCFLGLCVVKIWEERRAKSLQTKASFNIPSGKAELSAGNVVPTAAPVQKGTEDEAVYELCASGRPSELHSDSIRSELAASEKDEANIKSDHAAAGSYYYASMRC